MRVYAERLGAPVSWWLVVTACVALLGTTLWAGLSVTVAIVIYAGLESVCALALFAWGNASIEVTATELRAGSERLPLDMIESVTALDAAQTRALRGPRADPAAYMLVRPYLSRAVYVAVAGQPYWLIGTRRPGELAAAVERAAGASQLRYAAQAGGYAEEDGVGRSAPDTMG
jgi:hypothetical protein